MAKITHGAPPPVQSPRDSGRVSAPVRPTPTAPVGRPINPAQDVHRDGFNARGGDAPLSPAAVRAYQEHSRTAHGLTDRTAVGQLISRTPQIDNLDGRRGTNDDANRCGGAALLNGLLLDGNPARNAHAIRETAQEFRSTRQFRALTAEEGAALDAMEGVRRAPGVPDSHIPPTLTPPQAAHLQELVYDLGRASTGHAAADRGPGLSTLDMRTTAERLIAHGGFENSTHLNFRLERGEGVNHWTMSARSSFATARADSLPGANGYATVTSGLGEEGVAGSPNFVGDVTIERNAIGADRYVARAELRGSARSAIVRTEFSTLRGNPVGNRTEREPTWLDPATGGPTTRPD